MTRGGTGLLAISIALTFSCNAALAERVCFTVGGGGIGGGGGGGTLHDVIDSLNVAIQSLKSSNPDGYSVFVDSLNQQDQYSMDAMKNVLGYETDEAGVKFDYGYVAKQQMEFQFEDLNDLQTINEGYSKMLSDPGIVRWDAQTQSQVMQGASKANQLLGKQLENVAGTIKSREVYLNVE